MRRFLKTLDKALLPCMIGAVVAIAVIQLLGGSDALGWVSSVLQVITVALALSAWITAKALLRDHEDTIKNAKKDSESVILIVNVDKDIRGQVSTYAKKQNMIEENLDIALTPLVSGSGFNVEVSDRIVTVSNDNRMPIDQLEAEKYLRDFHSAFAQAVTFLRNKGVTTLHLFSSCPIVLAFYIGNELKNNFTVIPYHYANKTKTENDEDEIYFPIYLSQQVD